MYVNHRECREEPLKFRCCLLLAAAMHRVVVDADIAVAV